MKNRLEHETVLKQMNREHFTQIQNDERFKDLSNFHYGGEIEKLSDFELLSSIQLHLVNNNCLPLTENDFFTILNS